MAARNKNYDELVEEVASLKEKVAHLRDLAEGDSKVVKALNEAVRDRDAKIALLTKERDHLFKANQERSEAHMVTQLQADELRKERDNALATGSTMIERLDILMDSIHRLSTVNESLVKMVEAAHKLND